MPLRATFVATTVVAFSLAGIGWEASADPAPAKGFTCQASTTIFRPCVDAGVVPANNRVTVKVRGTRGVSVQFQARASGVQEPPTRCVGPSDPPVVVYRPRPVPARVTVYAKLCPPSPISGLVQGELDIRPGWSR